MNKTLKKLISIVLVLTLSLSAFAGVFSVFAEGTTAAVDDSDEEHKHTSFFELFVNFWRSIGAFIKYIFYDIFLGKPAPEIPSKPSYQFFS